MKAKHGGSVLKYTPSPLLDEPTVTEFWKMCLEIYEKATYVNDVAIMVNPNSNNEYAIVMKFKEGDKWLPKPVVHTYTSAPREE